MVSKKSLPINLYAVEAHGSPILDLRTRIWDMEIIKGVVTAALNDKPIIVYPIMRNKSLAIGRLIEVGILEKDKNDGKYVFVNKE